MRALLVASLVFAATVARATPCGHVPAGADWFFLSEAPRDYAIAAQHVLKAIREGLDPSMLARDPACLHVSILGDLQARSARLSSRRRSGLPSSTIGFHLDKLGADNTVFVTPSDHVPLEIVMLHETLHALSHRFSREAQKRGFSNLVEGVTDYITRELAVLSLGHERARLHSGYDEYVRFVGALVKRLGVDGPQLLADCYLRDGYAAFEGQTDRRLRISLGGAAGQLQRDQVRAATASLGGP